MDKYFANQDRHYAFDAATKTFTAYIALGVKTREALIRAPGEAGEKWNTLLENTSSLCSSVHTLVQLGARKGMKDFYPATASFVFVTTLNGRDDYSPEETLAILVNDRISYNLLDDVMRGSVPNSGQSGAGKSADSPASYSVDSGDTYDDSYAAYGDSGASAGGSGYDFRNGDSASARAKQYLDIMGFSRQRLIEQLEFDGYSHAEAVGAVDRCGADWNRQAARSARAYREIMSFSRSEMIEQLEFDGYTHSQAVYGADH